MAFALCAKNVKCPNCNYEGKAQIKGSGCGLYLILLILFFISFYIWPLFIVSGLMFLWLVFKPAKQICPKCKFENPIIGFSDNKYQESKKTFEYDKWNILIKYDSSFKNAYEKVEKYGPYAIEEFKKAFQAIGEKNNITYIADQIIKEQQLLMKQITYENEKYTVKTHKYDRLEDAINYLRLLHKKGQV